jgi:hypothetical protein
VEASLRVCVGGSELQVCTWTIKYIRMAHSMHPHPVTSPTKSMSVWKTQI